MSESREQTDAKGTLTPEETGRLTDQIAGLASSGLPLGPGLARWAASCRAAGCAIRSSSSPMP